jgi:hypothetical protein
MSKECCICKSNEGEVHKLPCCTSALFHKRCIDEGNTKCPVCQQDIQFQRVTERRNISEEKIYMILCICSWIASINFIIIECQVTYNMYCVNLKPSDDNIQHISVFRGISFFSTIFIWIANTEYSYGRPITFTTIEIYKKCTVFNIIWISISISLDIIVYCLEQLELIENENASIFVFLTLFMHPFVIPSVKCIITNRETIVSYCRLCPQSCKNSVTNFCHKSCNFCCKCHEDILISQEVAFEDYGTLQDV